jgi:hypothetical protein
MFIRLRQLILASLFLALAQAVPAQKNEIQIEKVTAGAGAVPGQLVHAFVSGVSDREMPPLPINRFAVSVTQNGVTRQAKVRSVGFAMLSQRPPNASASPRVDNLPGLTDQTSTAKPCQMVMFTVPEGLREGDANVVVAYLGRSSNAVNFKIANRLPVPRIDMLRGVVSSASRPNPSPEEIKQTRSEIRLERGHDTEILVQPLIDPEVPGSGVQVVFKQGNVTKTVNAQVTRREAAESSGNTVTFGPARYVITVRAPEDLALGPAQIEARLSANGQFSDPGSAEALITDSLGNAGNADQLKPHLANLGEKQVGIGQTITLAIDARWLAPDPSKTLIVLEQGSERVELKPEMNTAALRGGRLSANAAAVLIARVGDDFTGKVNVRVYNPARGVEGGLTEGIPIEIVEEVVPPIAIKVSEARNQDLAMLRALRSERLKQGRDSYEYDPDARYVTIQAIGLDHNPNFVRITFEQGGRRFTLKYKDFSLTMGDRLVVRVPDDIKPGKAQITIQNSSGDRLSDPVITTVEITTPVK